MIVLWGIDTDEPLRMVRHELHRVGAQALLINQRCASRCKLQLSLNGHIGGRLRIPGSSIDLNSVKSLYVRPYDSRRIAAAEGMEQSSPEFRRGLDFERGFASWVEMTPALVLNRPSAMASNNSKPFQLRLIRDAGFDIPETLVTTDPAAALLFWKRHRRVIYKSVSGVRSIVRCLGPEHEERLLDVAGCPTQLQSYIDGIDVRVHVVGEQTFSCEIDSVADDYRYPNSAIGDVRIQACELPSQIADHCKQLCQSLDLAFAGIDLRRTPSGKWYCFEVNPSPGFSYFELGSGHTIARSVAKLLNDSITHN